jgi:hypothetical protein
MTAYREYLEQFSLALEKNGIDAMAYEICQAGFIATDRLNEFMLWNISCNSELPWATSLVAMGADINYHNDEGETVLSRCVHAWVDRSYPVADVPRIRKCIWISALEFLSLGVDPNSRYLGFSVTGLALAWNCPELASLFVMAGANLDLAEEEGLRPTLRSELMESELAWPKNLIVMAERSRLSKV